MIQSLNMRLRSISFLLAFYLCFCFNIPVSSCIHVETVGQSPGTVNQYSVNILSLVTVTSFLESAEGGEGL